MEGYETRLYYEWEYTKKLGGFAQYVTLTYNNKNVPKYFGFNCLDNGDIRSLFHDVRFFRELEKRHGYSFKYFVGAELGEGGTTHNHVSKRGYGNNPHYHLILFFIPVPGFDNPHLSPHIVCNKIRRYWQGTHLVNGVEKPIYRYEDFNKGIVNFGKVHPHGVIQNFKAISYASKYVVKDVAFSQVETKLKAKIYAIYLNRSYLYHPEDSFDRSTYVQSYIDKYIKLFRSRHSQRVLCSHGLGLHALDCIKNKLVPFVSVPSNKGNINRSLPLYLYRKLFYDFKKDSFGKYYSKLNSFGIRYKCSTLFERISKLETTTRDNFRCLLDNRQLYFNYSHSNDISTPTPFAWIPSLLRKTILVPNDSDVPDNLFYKFALYEIVYKDRFYRSDNIRLSHCLSPLLDYKYSLKDTHKPMYHNSVYNCSVLSPLFKSFQDHKFFYKEYCLFDFFRSLNSYMVVQKDRHDLENYEHWKTLKALQFNISTQSNFYVI